MHPSFTGHEITWHKWATTGLYGFLFSYTISFRPLLDTRLGLAEHKPQTSIPPFGLVFFWIQMSRLGIWRACLTKGSVLARPNAPRRLGFLRRELSFPPILLWSLE